MRIFWDYKVSGMIRCVKTASQKPGGISYKCDDDKFKKCLERTESNNNKDNAMRIEAVYCI